MSGQKRVSETGPPPAETQRGVARETARIEEARRPPTMIPGAANPRVVEHGADFLQRVYRPHPKRWVTVGVWVFFIVLPALMALLILFAQVRRFFPGGG